MHAFTLFLASFLASSFVLANEKKIVCYYTNWSIYRESNGKFNIADIDASLCTHFIHSFLKLEKNKVVISDKSADLPDDGGKNGYHLFTELRKKNPSAKFLIAVGGWNDCEGPKYSDMVSSRESRKIFIDSVLALLKKYKFDGLDIDWEYPTERGGRPIDRDNFVILLRELRTRFDQEGDFLLSIAVGAAPGKATTAYDVRQVSKYVDFINLMTYDFHGSWDGRTGHHTALNGELSVESAVNKWLYFGCPKEKLIVGFPLYGKTFTLLNLENHGVDAPIAGMGQPGPYTKEEGIINYNEICENIKKGGWNLQYDTQAVAAFVFKGDQWISYDSVKSVKEKATYIEQMGLGGAMIWSIDADDFRGVCGVKYPILKTLNSVLRGGQPIQETEIQEEIKDSETVSIFEESENNEKATGECVKPGIARLPGSCGFLMCAPGFSNHFIRYEMTCGPYLCFNPKISACDWPKRHSI